MEQKVTKTYSGKAGCMCGCRGKWNYTAYGVINDRPGYNPGDLGERGAKIITNKVLKHPARRFDENANCYFVEENGRIMAVYFG